MHAIDRFTPAPGRCRALAVGLAVCMLVTAHGIQAAGAHDTSSSGVTVEDIALRDQLIFNQESLLNSYRCLFNVDTQVVPGGCVAGNPVQDPPAPVPFTSAPTPHEMMVRDGLIASQEALLNVYRCQFGRDT